MKRKTTKYAVIIISILLAELIHDYIQELVYAWVKHSQFGIYVSVLISMAAVVVIFYPAFNLIERYLHFASRKYIEGSKKISKNNFRGLLLGFILALILLFVGFCELWYQSNPIANLLH